jgi:DNA-directed RNA polymerase subunit RPC12/RpoP
MKCSYCGDEILKFALISDDFRFPTCDDCAELIVFSDLYVCSICGASLEEWEYRMIKGRKVRVCTFHPNTARV